MRTPAYITMIFAIIGAGLFSSTAMAQSSGYQCVNESLDIDIASQAMESALTELSEQTNCPISQKADVSGLMSNGVRGTYTPGEALAALVENRGLQGQVIKQGLSVSAVDTGPAAFEYNCQNERTRITIRAMRLDDALDELSAQTRCPVALGFDVSGLQSRAVNGSLTPERALRAMLQGTGLKGRSIKQGLEVRGGNQ